MSRKLITFDQVLLKLPKNKVIQTSELLGEFPGMKMPALTAQLMRLTSKDLVEKLGASTYRVADNRPYYRVSKYIILPLDLFELIVSYLREGITFQNIHVITGIPMESVKFVNKTLGGKIKPRIETKSSIEQARAKLNSATKEELDEIEVEEVEIVQPIEVETKYFAVSVQGINLKVEEGLHMKFEDGTVYISR
jgi:hypothetical protein